MYLPDIEAAMVDDASTPLDRGEPVSLMEPMRIAETSRHRPALVEIAFELASRSAGFRRSLPAGVTRALADLVRSMNCYYSNLLENHYTHPVDIERAIEGDYSASPEQRNLQLEARAHVAVQRWIDDGGLRGRTLSRDGICEIHRRFAEALPPDLLLVKDPDGGAAEKLVPGALRHHDVRVGHHVAVSAGALPRFLQHFEAAYGGLGPAETVLAAAAAHHRLLWIHPFLDGNGRVARLMSHAMLLEALDTGGVWSIARGLARDVVAYRAHLADCDLARRNDLDGRGALSEEALAAFTRFFLLACLDQVTFMEALVQPDRLRDRILLWAGEEIRAGQLPKRADRVLEAVLYRGELPRGLVPELVNASERQARRVVAALVERGVIVADSSRAHLRLVLPAILAPRWLPGLFPDRAA